MKSPLPVLIFLVMVCERACLKAIFQEGALLEQTGLLTDCRPLTSCPRVIFFKGKSREAPHQIFKSYFSMIFKQCFALLWAVTNRTLKQTPSHVFSWAYLFISFLWHFTCKLKALAICQDVSSTPHWTTLHAHMSSSCSFMCREQAKSGKSEEPCSAAQCTQNRGICLTVCQLRTLRPHKMATSLRASCVCPLYSVFQIGENSSVCVKFPWCPSAVLPVGQMCCSCPGSWRRVTICQKHKEKLLKQISRFH